MFNSSELSEELHTLKSELSRLLDTAGDGLFDAASKRADALADRVEAAVNELGEVLSEQEARAETLIAEHPLTTTAAAFTLGVVIGLMLRRH